MLPTLCLIIQFPCTTCGMSLKVRFRRAVSSGSSPARNLLDICVFSSLRSHIARMQGHFSASSAWHMSWGIQDIIHSQIVHLN